MSNPFKILEPTVVSFSGGRTSAYMLHETLKANNGLPEDGFVIFSNTGKEVEETLQFVKDCETFWNVPITWLEYISEKPGYKVVNFETASRDGKPFEDLIVKKNYLPNPLARFCTEELKVKIITKFMKDKGIEDFVTFVGIRADEPRRVAKMKINKDIKETPLATAKIGINHILQFWANQDFDLNLKSVNGNSILGNCDLCFLKKANHKLSLIQDNPDRAIWWINMENKVNAKFNIGHPDYNSMVQYSKKQIDMFSDDEEAIACFCGD